eukprot:CAMPEP_0172492008 /NCGR_PEP_ID=MMETSP1066-20121228/22975_1 /TAXON_ID=671091 /ORGANISM="Coscinodiscus wailesii, Strain CCMP2513" /LENGTH=315 /DNA_ID=CAMNT_0013261363 /DNA_START=241 /DNA_END=1188 /DNA_ORIENTATION=-
MAATKASLDVELEQWAKNSGFGTIVSSKPSGSSGWASFRKVTVDKPGAPEFFVKSSKRTCKEMFEGEALGLKAMFECSKGEDGLRIPEVFHYGDYADGTGSFLVMEFLNLAGRSDDYALGKAMARMHLAGPSKESGNPDGRFGFNMDNTIGGTPQPNDWTAGGSTDDWVGFFRDRRIGHQLDLAGDSACSKIWADIAPRLGALFEDVDVKPSLLHGDLWSGNIGSVEGRPTIYDPATYWGHHEAEWGMSWCAGFGKAFWDGYRSVIPEDEGFLNRKPLYDAYHQLNHYNLFGGGYIGSARGDLQSVKRCLDSMGA